MCAVFFSLSSIWTCVSANASSLELIPCLRTSYLRNSTSMWWKPLLPGAYFSPRIGGRWLSSPFVAALRAVDHVRVSVCYVCNRWRRHSPDFHPVIVDVHTLFHFNVCRDFRGDCDVAVLTQSLTAICRAVQSLTAASIPLGAPASAHRAATACAHHACHVVIHVHTVVGILVLLVQIPLSWSGSRLVPLARVLC